MGYKTTEAQAREEGEALRRKLKGQGWELRVWENLGWHYEVNLSTPAGTLSVHPYLGEDNDLWYWASLTRSDYAADEVFWHSNEHRLHRDPNKAVEEKLDMAQSFLREAESCVRLAYEAVHGAEKIDLTLHCPRCGHTEFGQPVLVLCPQEPPAEAKYKPGELQLTLVCQKCYCRQYGQVRTTPEDEVDER